MRIAQIVLAGASEYERKSQRIDNAALSVAHDVVIATPAEVVAGGADIAHVYASHELTAAPFSRFPIPYVASADMPVSRFRLRQPRRPELVLLPAVEPESTRSRILPEAVEDRFFDATGEARRERAADRAVVGSFARRSTQNVVEQTMARIQRFRSDVAWRLFDAAPSPEDLAGVDAWIDPAVDEHDLDGFVAEALVVGVPVVAARTAINAARLEQGRAGLLVPPRDPNEMTHAILTILFKREVSESRSQAARQTISKYRARQRVRILARLYETLLT